jgi:cell division protein FtsZ
MFSSRVLQRIQPCIGRSTRTTNIITNSIRYKSTKSNILKKASMALGKQSKKDAIKQANAKNLRKREPVLKVTPAATAASMPEPPSVDVDVDVPHENFGIVPPSVSEEPPIPAQVPPVSAPVQPPAPAPSAFSRTEFHQGHLHEFAPRIVVVGVGGGGGNAVNNMIANELSGVDFLALNTDAQHLSTTLTENRLQIGTNLTSGLGCGANPDAGRLAAEESKEEITELLGDAHMVFVTAGMGGGTGTGAAPVVAEVCYNLGILTVGVVTKPFRFEGTHRMRLANEGIGRLKEVVDTLIMIPNQNLFHLANDDTSFMDSFAMADNVLLAGVRSITDLMTTPGLINFDFADVQSVMHGMGNAMLGTGVASKNDLKDQEERAILAAEQALANPLLGENMDIGTAKGMLVNITGGKDMTLFEVDRAAQCITERVIDEHANIIFGSAYDESLDGSIRVSVVATGIDEKAAGQE